MIKRMKAATYICQITEDSLKVVTSCASDGGKREIQDIDFQKIIPGLSEQELSDKIAQMLRKLGFKNSPIIVALPCSKATCRQFKVPAQAAGEIEKIVSLQASRYLPYPAEELVTGYQVISTSSDGYSLINLIIVHKDVIAHMLKVFEGLKASRVSIILSSYGLAFFYNRISSGASALVMFVDFNGIDSEAAILRGKQMLFSRSFKLFSRQPGLEKQCVEEINKSLDIYHKESAKDLTPQIVFMSQAAIPGVGSALKEQFGVPAEEIVFPEDLKLPLKVKEFLKNSDNSFLSLLGLGLEDVAESLNLLPRQLKEKIALLSLKKERKTIALFILATLLIFAFGVNRHLDNKARYLSRLKEELNKIAKEAAPLEGIEKRFRFISGDSHRKDSSLDLIRELYQIIPSEIKLVNFSYEDGQKVTVRGQARELNSVFAFVGKLEESPVFKTFKIKIRYATWRNNRSGALVDFEIICTKKNAKSSE